jgi:hypothetical protein
MQIPKHPTCTTTHRCCITDQQPTAPSLVLLPLLVFLPAYIYDYAHHVTQGHQQPRTSPTQNNL